jgi:hypothetical protein
MLKPASAPRCSGGEKGPIATPFVLDDLDNVPDLVFSQSILSAEQVADAVIGCVIDRRRERAVVPARGFCSESVCASKPQPLHERSWKAARSGEASWTAASF